MHEQAAITNLVSTGGLSFQLRGELVDANPDSPSLAPAVGATLAPTLAWSAQESGAGVILTTFTPRGAMKSYTRVNARRIDEVTQAVTAGTVELVAANVGATPTRCNRRRT